MNAVASEVRKQLSRVVLRAREAAETGARKALEALAVHEADPYKHLDEEQRLLRRALRAQARQLGDEETRPSKGAYRIAHLQEKVAYDQWHRLLFARFLLENNLLMSPEHGVAVTLADCEELAPTLGLRDGWAVAARFAAVELPEIFRDDDPAGRIELPAEDRNQLVQLVTGLPAEVFLADDSLGWVYHFWLATRMDEVNDSGKKIGADELAPVTQLFTEDYMVLFLLHNTLGAWWAGKQQVEWEQYQTEEDCRKAVSLPGVGWTYLRFVRTETGMWRPAAGTFDGWPKAARELRVLDPCMGSGHFLVAELPVLVALRIAQEGLTQQDAVIAVLRDNLFGLELDPRCAQIAAFNMALAAWKLAGWQCLPPLNLACSGLAPRTKIETWTALAGDNPRLCDGMERLYQLFKEGPTLGSLINPRALGGDLLTAEFHDLQPLLQKALGHETARRDEALHELRVTAQGLAHAAEILASHFTLVATNVPYLGEKKQAEVLKDYCRRFYPTSKADLAATFVERAFLFCMDGGVAALVTKNEPLFLGQYTGFRTQLLSSKRLNLIAKLGPRAFEAVSGERVNVVCLIGTSASPRDSTVFGGLDVSSEKTPSEKAEALGRWVPLLVVQSSQLLNPDARIIFEESSKKGLLRDYAHSMRGIVSGDTDLWIRCFWEVTRVGAGWRFLQSTADELEYYGGRQHIIDWKTEGRGMLRPGVENRAYGCDGVSIALMSGSSCSLYTGELYDNNCGAIVPYDGTHLEAIWAYCSSELFWTEVRKIDQKMNVTNATLLKVPFDLVHWQRVAAQQFPDGLPKPFSNDPTQWLFSGHPAGADDPLQVAVARLLGYRWPRQTDSSFPDCPALGPDGLEPFVAADGIVCLSATKGEEPAAEQLRALLAAAYGSDWGAAKQAEMLTQVEHAGTTLDEWLRNGFFEQHCALFHHRPFVWHIWDGRKDGFGALVNYHQLTRANLEKLTYAYLGDWIRRQQTAVEAGEAGSDARLLAAKQLQGELQKILEGESPYDTFVRWKSLAQQPIGWDPDINDGVRLNIRPFMQAKDVGKKRAGILRTKPNIHWGTDRGTDVASAPWFGVFKGERINDFHLTLEKKRKAREKANR